MKKLIILLLSAILLTSCAPKPKIIDIPPVATDVAQQTEMPLPTSIPDMITVTFTGRVDENSIEVKKEDGSIEVFRLNTILKQNFSSLGILEGSAISIRYSIADGEKTIRQIVKH